MKDAIKGTLLFCHLSKIKYDELIQRIDAIGIQSITQEERKMIQKTFNLLRKNMKLETFKLF